MKKTALLKKLTPMFLIGVGLFITSIFSSCENFLNANETKRQIEEAIAYANAKECTVFVQSDPDYGTFLSGGEKKCKVGFSTEIQFTVNKDSYKFLGFEAVSSNDNSIDRGNLVEFKYNEKDSNEREGIYKYTVKLLIAASDILIRPVCLAYPKVVQVTPTAENMAISYTPIVVKFNIPMENDDGTSPLSSLDNISIKSGDESLNEYFLSAKLNQEKTILTITPNNSKLNHYIETNSAIQLITLKISFKDVVLQRNSVELPFIENASEITVQYKAGKDTEPPVVLDWFMTRYEITAENGPDLDDDKKFLKKTADEDDFMNEAMYANLAENYVYLWGKVYDKDTGLQMVNVRQYREAYKFTTNESLSDATESYSYFIPGSDNIQTIDDGKGNTIFCIKIYLLEAKKIAGDILFDISVEDGSGNTNKEGSLKISCIVTSNLYESYKVNHNNNFTVGNLIDNPATIYCILPKTVSGVGRQVIFSLYYKYDDDDPNLTSVWNGYIEGHKLNYECEYIDKTGETKFLQFVKAENPGLYNTKADEKTDLYYVQLKNIDEDNIGGQSFTVNIKHDKYVLWSREYSLPGRPYVQSVSENNGIKSISFGGIDGNLMTYNNSIYSYKSVQPLSNDYELYAYCYKSFGGDYNQCLYGNKIGPFTLDSISALGEKPNAPVVKDCVIRPQATDYLDIIFDVEVPDENGTLKKWDQVYDLISLDYSDWSVTSKKTSIFRGNEVAVTIETATLKNEIMNPKVKLVGIKNLQVSDPIEYAIKLKESEDINTYDNILPGGPNSSSAASYFPDKENFVLLFDDYFTGIAEGSITVGDTTFNLYPSQINSGWYETSKIPADLFRPYRKSYVYFLKDKAGNILQGVNFMDMAPHQILTIDKPKGIVNENVWTPDFAITSIKGTLYYSEYNSGWQQENRITRLNNCTINGAKFVKFHNIHQTFNNWWDYYEICYTGTCPEDNDFNLLFFNGSNRSSVAVSSNAPVLVRTLVTNRPYDECKDWSIAQWQTFPEEIDIKQYSFETPGITKRYDIPLSKIKAGECYVVIAHYADGSAQKTEVVQYNP